VTDQNIFARGHSKKDNHFFFYRGRHLAARHGFSLHKKQGDSSRVEQIIFFIMDFAMEDDFMVQGQFSNAGFHRKEIIIFCWAQKSRVDLDNRHNDAEGFDAFVSYAKASQGFCPAYFVKLRIVTMVNKSHLISKRVMDSYWGVVRKQGK